MPRRWRGLAPVLVVLLALLLAWLLGRGPVPAPSSDAMPGEPVRLDLATSSVPPADLAAPDLATPDMTIADLATAVRHVRLPRADGEHVLPFRPPTDMTAPPDLTSPPPERKDMTALTFDELMMQFVKAADSRPPQPAAERKSTSTENKPQPKGQQP